MASSESAMDTIDTSHQLDMIENSARPQYDSTSIANDKAEDSAEVRHKSMLSKQVFDRAL